jgi:hypothetical protein
MRKNGNNGKDARPDPKPRKRPNLWQAYLAWNELVEMRKRHLLRISSIDAGKSNLDLQFENDFIEATALDKLINSYKKVMIFEGEKLGKVWEWAITIKGLKEGSLAAQLLAQIDDIGKFDTVSKLWSFSGYSVKDGKRIYAMPGSICPYNKRLKSIVYLIGQSFIYQQTPEYVDIYYQSKEEYRKIHPEKIVVDGKTKYNDGHIHAMAMRKMEKIFLQHVWVIWRESEGLPVTLPYAQAILGHEHYIEPIYDPLCKGKPIFP